MDLYCIELGFLLDNSNVKTLEDPSEHSVHCLVDVGPCVNSPFEVLLDVGEDLYARGFRLDDQGSSKEMMVKLARDTGTCSTCTSAIDNLFKGFRAVMEAEVMDLNSDKDVPPTISVLDAYPSHDLETDACSEIFNMTDFAELVIAGEETLGDSSPESDAMTTTVSAGAYVIASLAGLVLLF